MNNNIESKIEAILFWKGEPISRKKLGEIIKGESIGLSGCEFKITGGSDDSGFPMRPEINLAGKKKIYARKGIGIKTKYKGNFIRKTVAGNSVYQKTSQLNLAVVKAGKKSLEEIFGKKEEGGNVESQD